MRPAAPAQDVRTPRPRETQHQLGAVAARFRRRFPGKAHQPQRTARPWPAKLDQAPVRRYSPRLGRVDRYLMSRFDTTLRGDDEVALGAAACRIKAPRD